MEFEKSEPIIELGPLAALAGEWEGIKGDDTAPSGARTEKVSRFRERLVLTPIGRVDNHEQMLHGLRYSTTAWRLNPVPPETGDNPFHEEVGYWLWDAKAKQVLRCFIVPRGVTVLAGGTVEPDAKSFTISAKAGSDTYGICSNLFLDAEFKTVRYELKVTIHGPDSFSYDEVTELQMKGRPAPFQHRDKNTLTRTAAAKRP